MLLLIFSGLFSIFLIYVAYNIAYPEFLKIKGKFLIVFEKIKQKKANWVDLLECVYYEEKYKKSINFLRKKYGVKKNATI